MADIDIDTNSWRSHAEQVDGIGKVVEQGGSAYMAALDGNVFGVFTPVILPTYMVVSEIFAQRNAESGQRVQKGATLMRKAARDFDSNEECGAASFMIIGLRFGAY